MIDKTLKLIEENREDIELVAEYGTPQMRKMAQALLAYYYKKTKKKKKRRKRSY